MFGRASNKSRVLESQKIREFNGFGLLTKTFFGICIFLGIVFVFLIIANTASAGDYGVAVQYNSPSNGIGNVTPAVDYTFTVDVINTGSLNLGEDINFTVELDAVSIAAGWTVTPSGLTIIPNVQMGVANKTTETVIVRAPSNAKYQDSAVINVSVDVIGHKGEVGNQDSLQLRANVLQVFGVLMTTTQDSKTGNPGNTISYEIKITNQGNGNDTFSFSDSGSLSGVWSEADVTLGPDEFVNIFYNVTITSGSPPGTFVNELKVTSTGDISGLTFDTLDVTININTIYDLSIDGIPLTGSIKPGESANFTITVENLGTGDDTAKFNIEGINRDWSKMYNGSIQQYQIFVPAGNTVTMTFVITVPSGESITSGIIFTINATSMGSGDTIYDTFDIIVDVEQSYDGYISTNDPSQTTDPGDYVEFTLLIHNEGNGEDSFIIIIENPLSGWIYLVDGQSNPTIGPIPSGNLNSIVVRITPWVYEPQGTYFIIIRAISQGNPSFSFNTTLTVIVDQIYGVELQPSGTTVKDVDIEGGSTPFYVKVYNRGNGPDNLHLTIVSIHDYWIEMSPSQVSPNPNDFTLITVWLNISSRAEWESKGMPDPIFIDIEVETPGDPSPTEAEGTKDILSLSADVIPIYGLSADITPSLTQDVDIGSQVTFTFQIHDTGTTSQQYRVTTMSYDSNNLSSPSFIPSFNPFPTSPTGGDVTFHITISPKPNGLVGSYTIWVRLVVHQDDMVQFHVNLTVNIKENYKVQLDAQNGVTNLETPLNTIANYTLIITNTGNTLDTFFLGALSPYSQLVSFWPSNITLNSGQSGFVICGVFADKTIVENNNLYSSGIPSSIQVTSIGDTNEYDSLSLDTDITEVHAFNISSPDIAKEAQPGDMSEFVLNIVNSGTTGDKYVSSILSYDTSVFETPQITPPGTIPASSLPPGTSTSVTIEVTVKETDPKVQIGNYHLTVRISIDGFPSIYKDFNFTVRVERVYVHILTTDDDSEAANVNDNVNYLLELKNKGNGQETFNIAATGPYSNLVTLGINQVTLNQEESKIFGVSVFVDKNVIDSADLYGLDLVTTIRVTSKNDPNQYFVDLSLYTTINDFYDFELSTLTSGNTMAGEPGETIYFPIVVRNTGSTLDHYNLYAVSYNAVIFNFVDVLDINTNVNELESKQTTATISINSENDKALSGEYDIEIAATSKANLAITKTIIIHINITPKAGLDVDSSQTASGEPGEIIDYIFRITNKGNSPDTYDLALEGENNDWGQILDSTGTSVISELTLPAYKSPGHFRDIIVRVTIPSNGETTANTPYPIDFVVTSRIENAVSIIRQATTTVEDYVELILEYIGSGEPSKDYDPNQKAPKFSFRVTNNGNQQESDITILVDPADWNYSPSSVIEDVGPGGSATFALEFTIPSDEALGEYELEVYVHSSIDAEVYSDTVLIKINITKPDLSISPTDIMGLDDMDYLKGKVGNSVTISAVIHNDGTSDAKSIQVRLYEDSKLKGTKSISSIEAGGSKTVDFRWTVIAEEVEIRVEITPQEEIEENNNKISIQLDLRPDLSFYGQKLDFSNPNPDPGDEITITASIRNSGGDAEDVTVKFYEGNQLIGMDTLDIDSDEIGEAQIEWEIPNQAGETLDIRAEIDYWGHYPGAEVSESIQIAESGIDIAGSTSLLYLIILSILGICLVSVFVGYQIGKIREEEESFDDFNDVEETEFTETNVLPPPPPPPPPPPIVEETEKTIDKENDEKDSEPESSMDKDIEDQEKETETKPDEEIKEEEQEIETKGEKPESSTEETKLNEEEDFEFEPLDEGSDFEFEPLDEKGIEDNVKEPETKKDDIQFEEEEFVEFEEFVERE